MTTRALQELYKKYENWHARTTTGHTSDHAGSSYTAAAQKALSNAPTLVATRGPLQNPAGQLLKRPNDDGTMTAGTFGIDEWGRVVAL